MQDAMDYVVRLYRTFLDREPDDSGLRAWLDALQARRKTPADVARAFALGEECASRGMGEEDFVRSLYTALLDREADPQGLTYWLDALEQGWTRGTILDGFTGSSEFEALCERLQPTPAPDLTPHTAHFKASEFACHDGTQVPAQYWPNLQALMERLEVLREACGSKPITINSGYRTPAYNAKCGGAKQSQHLYAKAADIRVAGMTPQEVYTAADKVFAMGGVGKYATFTHVDVRGKRARW